jgi:hypothetical protein
MPRDKERENMLQQIRAEQKAERAVQKALQRGAEALQAQEGVSLGAQQGSKFQLLPDEAEYDEESVIDEKLTGLFFPFIPNYDTIGKLLNNKDLSFDMKQAMYTNFRTSVESELKQLPEKLSLREFTRFILRLAREILSSESTYLSNQPKPIGDDIKKMIIAITRENKAELANRGYDTNSVKSLKVTRFLVEQYIIEITGIDQSSVLADLVIQKLVDAGKKFKRIPSPTSDGIIDQNYLAELFAGTNLPELKAFYEEYFREISTYELMKKLPADELKDTITNLYARRNLGSNAPAHMTQSTVTASALPAPPSSPVQEPIATSSALPSQPSSKKKKKKTGSGLGGDDNDEEPRSNVYISISYKPGNLTLVLTLN